MHSLCVSFQWSKNEGLFNFILIFQIEYHRAKKNYLAESKQKVLQPSKIHIAESRKSVGSLEWLPWTEKGNLSNSDK